MEQRIGWELALATLSLAFALSLLIAWIYTLTHEGLSYMRSFVQSIALGGILAAMVMMAVGDNVARGLGVVGALTIVRFRTTLKDTRDLMFVFATLGAGVACGVQSFAIAIAGTFVFVVAVLFVSRAGFGSQRQYDAVLRMRVQAGAPQQDAFAMLLKTHCRRFVLINMKQIGADVLEHAYQVELRDRKARAALLRSLEELPNVSGINLLMQDASVEP
jgi:uncharacterized membrane protein YhiD involved in acid resistance